MSLRRSLLALLAVLGLAAPLASPAQAIELDDPLRTRQWALASTRAEGAWKITRGQGSVIAIVDSGVDLTHPDLESKVLPGATFLGCGDTGCGDGDWRSGPANRRVFDSGHGTHVAGLAAAATGNGVGVAGVAPDAMILPVKVLDADGGSFEDISRGIRWAVDNGADVINLSLSADPGVQALTFTGIARAAQEAVNYASEEGVVVVAAAGNSASVACDTPAFDDGVLCVVATDKREQRAAYSSLGLNPGLLAVSAPGGSLAPICGENVVSSVPPAYMGGDPCSYGVGYGETAGTSMAAPHVSGVAALLAAQGRDREAILDAITSTARHPGLGVRGIYTPAFGFGLVDAAAAVNSN